MQKKKAGSGSASRIKGLVLVVGSVAVGAASGLGLDQALPKRGPGLMAHFQSAESEEEVAAVAPEGAEEAAAPAELPAEEVVAVDEAPVESIETGEAPVAEEAIAAEPLSPEAESAPQVAEADPVEVTEAVPATPMETVAAPKPARKNPAVRQSAPAAGDALSAWWATPGESAFAVQFVGQVAGQKSLAILFSQEVATADVVAGNVKLIDADGKPVSGGWKPGKDGRLAVLPDLRPGRYTVVIDSSLASVTGQPLQAALRGPVYIR